MKERQSRSESGQVMVFLVLGIIGMMGFAALAIDGGMILTERRAAQNVADAAVMASAWAIFNGATANEAKIVAANVATANGYALTPDNFTITQVTSNGYTYHLVDATITSSVPSAFAHLVFGQLQTTVNSQGRFSPTQVPMGGFGIVTLGNCLQSGGADTLLEITGGGNSGGIRTYNGSMFINTPENASNHCSIDEPSSSGNDGIRAMDTGFNITSVGSYNYNGTDNVSPLPVQTGFNGGVPIGDPLAPLANPTCTTNGYNAGSTYYPGNWDADDLGPGTYEPGIYCVSNGEIRITGSDSITADGALFYFQNAGMYFAGNGDLQLSAPTSINCTGQPGLTTSSCTYAGIALMSRSSQEIAVGGNGNNRIVGTVYIPNTQLNANGGGATPDEALVWGQVIGRNVLNNGNGSLDVWYREDLIFRFPPTVNLEK